MFAAKAAAALVIVGSLTPAAPAASRASASASATAAAKPAFTANAAVMHGHGELAVVHGRHLYLLGDGVTGTRGVGLKGAASKPVWSFDGEWLAATVSPAPSKARPHPGAAVWLVSRQGKVIRRLTPTHARDSVASWSPVSEAVAVTYRLKGADHVDVVVPNGSRTAIATAPRISGVAWSPSGSRLAIGRAHFVKPARASSWRSRVVTVAVATGARQTVWAAKGGVLEVARWWPDGSGILFWNDPQGSASLAADGVPLYDVTLDHHIRRLAKRMLPYPQWVAAARIRDEVALIAGGDRVLTAGHKHLVVCGSTSCRSVRQGKHQVSLYPAFAGSLRLSVARDLVTGACTEARCSPAKVAATGGIRFVNRHGTELVDGGAGATSPVWSHGSALLEVKGRSLWLVAPAGAKPRRVAGPLPTTGAYYGFVPWTDSFAWSEAVR